MDAPHQVDQDQQGAETSALKRSAHRPASLEPSSPSFVPGWSRRPLSADLTSRFESAGRRDVPRRPFVTPANAEERGVEASPPEQKDGLVATEGMCQKEKESETGEEITRGSIKKRISQLFDSASSASAYVRAPPLEVEPQQVLQPIAEKDVSVGPSVGVKQRIKALTAETPPAQTPSPKPTFKPRPLSQDLTKW